MMSRRVLHVINGESFAGAERVQDLLAMRLPEFGYDVSFACLKLRDFALRRRSQVPLLDFPMSNRFDLRVAWRLSRIIQEQRVAVLHTHTPRAALAGRLAVAFTGTPMVHHVHSPTARDTEDAWRNRVNATMEDLSVSGAKCLLAVSSSLVDYLKERGFRPDRVKLVANGVPSPALLPQRKPPGHHWVVGCMALFRPRKGVEVLLDAVALLMREGSSIRLRMVGTFETSQYEQLIRAHAKRAGVDAFIDWRGFSADVQSELACMDLFAVPSLYGEGMPMVLLEAMAAGVPAVASAVEGIPEVLEHGRCGVLTAPGDATALAAALRGLMGDGQLWQTMRERAFQRQVERYSDRAMARAVASVYDEVLQ